MVENSQPSGLAAAVPRTSTHQTGAIRLAAVIAPLSSDFGRVGVRIAGSGDVNRHRKTGKGAKGLIIQEAL